MKHAILLLAWVVCPTAAAQATDLPCGAAEKGAVELDGLTDDWKDVDGIDAGGRDANLSFTLKCNVDATTLYLLVDVRDNYFVRTAQAKPGEDHLELTLGGKKHVIFPGNAAAIKEKVPKGVKVVSSLQEKGWALEIALPLRSVPGFRPGAPQIPYTAAVADCDSKATLKTEKVIHSSGRINFAEGEGAFESFLKDRKLKPGDVFWDKPITLGRSAGGRALMAGRYLALISDGYVFMELPFKDRRDLKDAHVLDLAGDGRHALVLRYTERGGERGGERGAGGARDVLAVWRADGERFQRVFAAEIGKSQGQNRIENKVAFVKRGRATDVVIEAGSASGFSATTYKESPAEDMIPVLLPWGDDRKARYQFRGDEYLRQ